MACSSDSLEGRSSAETNMAAARTFLRGCFYSVQLFQHVRCPNCLLTYFTKLKHRLEHDKTANNVKRYNNRAQRSGRVNKN